MLQPSEIRPVLPSRKCNSISDDDSGCALDEYSWIPQGMSHLQVHEYVNSLPRTKVPRGSHASQRHRIQQLLRQLPPQDSKASYCDGLNDDEKNEFYLFQSSRKRHALGHGTIDQLSDSIQNRFCAQCHEKLTSKEFVISALRAGPHSLWHPACFVCCVCKEILADLIYFYKDGKIYCGRHHAETLKPRCVTCDEIIFADECTEAEGFSWHTRHFSCFECNQLLGGQQYIMRDGRPFCCPCFELLYTECCESCGNIISIEEGRMTHEGHHWHATDLCFACRTCGQSLKQQSFLLKQSELYCSASCLAEISENSNHQGKLIACKRQMIRPKGSVDDSLPEDSVSWTSVSNREDQSSVSTYSELNFKSKTSSDDPGLHDSHSLAETDSGLNLTYTAYTGHINEIVENYFKDKNLSTSGNEVVDLFSRKGCSSKPDQIRSLPLRCKNSLSNQVDANNYRESREQSAKKSSVICPTNYMINPDRYFINSPVSESQLCQPSSTSHPNSPLFPTQGNCLESCAVISPVSQMSNRQTINRLSPVNEICSAELLAEYNSAHSPKVHMSVKSQQNCLPAVNLSTSPRCQLCKSCSRTDCNCLTSGKASLPDLSYTTVVCETKWKQNPYLWLKRNSSSIAQNLGAARTAAPVGGRRASGYDSDSALKRRRIKLHHKRDTDGSPNQPSRRIPRLGVGDMSRYMSNEFRPNSASQQQLPYCCNVNDWKEFKSAEMTKCLAELNLEYEGCSTCSSSSGSDFDYYLDRQNTQFPQPTIASDKRLKKRKTKQCTIS